MTAVGKRIKMRSKQCAKNASFVFALRAENISLGSLVFDERAASLAAQ